MKRTHSLAALPCGALALLLGFSCSDSTPEQDGGEAPTEATEKDTEAARKKAYQESIDGLFSGKEKTEDVQTLPTLGFEVNAKNLPIGGSWREHPTLADLDQDGKADLIATNREENGLNIWKSFPGKDWKHKLNGVAEDLMYGGSDCGDLDGDGDIDILFASHKLGLRSFLNDGAMNWSEVSPTTEASFLSLDIALGNFNGDEHLDAATISQFLERGQGGLGIFFGKGDGSFELQTDLRKISLPSRFGVQVETLDVNGDDLDDIFLTAEKGCRMLITQLSESGELSFEDRSKGLPLPPRNMGNSLRAFVPIDVDGDGAFEVAFAGLINPNASLEERYSLDVLRWNADTNSWEGFGKGLPNGKAYSDVLSDDFNGDGHSDLLVIGTGVGASIYLGDGTGSFEAKGMLEGTLAGGRGAIGDIDGDGKPDVAVICGATKARPDAGAVQTFLNRDEAWD